MTAEKWKRLSTPFMVEEMRLLDKAEDEGLTEEEREMLKHVRKIIEALFRRFLRDWDLFKGGD